MFVREKRRKADGHTVSNLDHDRREIDPDWVGSLRIKIHPSYICWINTGKAHDNAEERDKYLVRCAPNWNGSREWRSDYIWLQEFNTTEHGSASGTVAGG